ncbi:FecR family protein [Methylomonas sp. BW4-1]|uniref:FecR family protein n=1 Tax=Methylomonas defluvii TaxID=3045149 RepID=A0ABU4UAZ3_9GAMM|nr:MULTISPECIES: FecR family protein [unclassified Methylomonas]MDX8126622.1 FecR family protein [Methylomonas sp. OY6]
MKRLFACCSLGLALCMPNAASADETVIGYIKTINDQTTIDESSGPIKASLGSPIHVGNVIKTDQNGAAGVTLKDNTILSIGPNTEFKIEAYQFEPQQDKLQLNASLLKGTLHYISGVIAKLKPEAVTVKTPTGVIAVRGTRFLVKVED